MSNWARTIYVGAVVVTISVVYVVYARVGLPMLDMLENTPGPFGEWILRLEGLVPLLLMVLLLGAMVYLLVGPIQQERSRDPVRRRGR